jgi:hypothetical protein
MTGGLMGARAWIEQEGGRAKERSKREMGKGQALASDS